MFGSSATRVWLCSRGRKVERSNDRERCVRQSQGTPSVANTKHRRVALTLCSCLLGQNRSVALLFCLELGNNLRRLGRNDLVERVMGKEGPKPEHERQTQHTAQHTTLLLLLLLHTLDCAITACSFCS